jgi:hypothetical protein
VLAWLLKAWKEYAHRAGSYQTRVLLSIAYAVLLGPGAWVGRLFGSQLLDLDARSDRSTWQARGPQEPTLDALRRQF